MGGSNSTPGTENRRVVPTDRVVAEALENQKRMYEEKYEELRKSQRQTVKVLLQVQKKENDTVKVVEALESQKRMYEEQYEKLRKTQSKTEQALQNIQKNLNRSQTPNNNVCQPPITHTSTQSLYPNLSDISNNNAQASTAYASPSTSNFQRPSNTKLSAVQPTTPLAQIEPAFEALSAATAHPINKLRPSPQAQPGLSSPVLTVPSAPKAPAVDTRSPAAALAFTKPIAQSETRPGLSSPVVRVPSAPKTPAVDTRSPNAALAFTKPRPQSEAHPGLYSPVVTVPSAPKAPGVDTRFQFFTKPRPQSEAHPGLSSPVVTVPSAPKAPGVDTRSQFFTKPRPQSEAHPGLSPLRTQRPMSPSAQAVPSTSSANAQPVNLPEPPQIKSKTRNFPRSNTAPSVQCVTCSDKLGLQIYQCKNGHSSCRECRFKVHQCGRCHELITDMRNLTLETMIADLKLKKLNGERMKCPNSVDGCCLSMKSNEIEDHLKECPYREMDCPLTDIFGICTWKGKINQIGMHFKELHQEHYEADVDKEMHLLNINVDHKIVYLVKLGAFHFLVHIKVYGDQKTICMTVQTLGTKFSASKWTYEFHVYNKREPRRKYQYIDTCSSNSESIREIFQEKKCAVLSSEYAKTFLDNNKLAYKFYIKKRTN